MKNPEPRARINSATRLWGVAFLMAALSLAGPAQATDYCPRHITNNRDVDVTLNMCNTSGDCDFYRIAPHTSVLYAIPDNNAHATLEITGESFRTTDGHQSNTITIYHHQNSSDVVERILQSEDWCHISRLGGYDDTKYRSYGNAQTLGGADFRTAVTVNSPANGDIIVNAPPADDFTPRFLGRDAPTLYAPFDLTRNRAGPMPPGILGIRPDEFDGVFRDGTRAAVTINISGGEAWFFGDGWHSLFLLRVGEVGQGYPARTTEANWPGLLALGPIDAAVNAGNGKIYFFGGGNYLRFDIANWRTDSGYPRPVNETTWPGLPALGRVEAVTNIGNGKLMFFSGRRMLRYDVAADRADPGYPQTMTNQNFTAAVPPDGYHIAVAMAWNEDGLGLFYTR